MSDFVDQLIRELDSITDDISKRVDAWMAESDPVKSLAMWDALRRDGIIKYRGET